MVYQETCLIPLHPVLHLMLWLYLILDFYKICVHADLCYLVQSIVNYFTMNPSSYKILLI